MTERARDGGQRVPLDRDGLARRLEAARGPALVIEPATARLLAANLPGAQLLGHDPATAGPLPLDSAMPAVMDLRRAVRNGAALTGPASLALVFWTPGGMRRLHGRIDVLAFDGVAGPVILVEIEPDADAAPISRAHLPQTHEDTAHQGTSQPAPSDTTLAIEPYAVTPPVPRAPETIITSGHATDERPTEATATTKTTPPTATPKHETAPPDPTPQIPPATPVTSPAPPAAPITPQVRTDQDTLKAIARQILAGQRSPSAAVTQPSSPRAQAPTAPHEALRPTRSDEQTHPRPRQRPASTPPAMASMPAAARPPASDVRRSLPHKETAPPRRQAPQPADSAHEPTDTPASAAGRTTHRTNRAAEHAHPTQPPAPSRTLPLQPPVAIGACDAAAGNRNATKPGAKPAAAPLQPPQPEDSHRGLAARRAIIRRLAHELKTPVGAIMSAAEVMKDERLGPIGDERYLRYARDIFLSASHALDVIERTLGGPQATPGPGELSFTNLDLNQLVSEILSTLEHLAETAGVKLEARLAPRLPLVIADATSVRQIVLNVLTNALKFTPRGGHVGIATRLADPALQLTVTDTGPGISEATIADIMHKTPEDPTSPRPGGGHGIGLPLALSLAHANGAELSIARSQSGGTCVTLAFPASRQIPV